MKKRLTITGVFNDYFTNYEDKEDSMSVIVDDVENCTCYKENGRCLIHFPPPNYTISDLEEDK